MRPKLRLAAMDPWIRLRRVWNVLKDAKPVGLAIGGLVGAFLFGWFVSHFQARTLSATLRYGGMVLQLFGVGLVASGLHDLRVKFKQPTIGDRINRFFQRLRSALAAPKSVSIELGPVEIHSMAGELKAELSAAPGASLEDRVTKLEKDLKTLRDQMNTKEQQLRLEINETKECMEKENRARHEADNEINQTIQELAVGGLNLEFVGVIWLVVGIVTTSIPDGLANYLWAI